jgi:hypothetical protein
MAAASQSPLRVKILSYATTVERIIEENFAPADRVRMFDDFVRVGVKFADHDKWYVTSAAANPVQVKTICTAKCEHDAVVWGRVEKVASVVLYREDLKKFIFVKMSNKIDSPKSK